MITIKGIVKFYNRIKAYGFITSEEDSKDYFIHQSGLGEDVIIDKNDSVTFDIEQGDRGPKAINVKKVEEEKKEEE